MADTAYTFGDAEDISRGGSSAASFDPALLAGLATWLLDHDDAKAGRAIAVPTYVKPTTKGVAGSTGYKLAIAVTRQINPDLVGTTGKGNDKTDHVRSYVVAVDKAGKTVEEVLPAPTDKDPNATKRNPAAAGYSFRIGRKNRDSGWTDAGPVPVVADTDTDS